MFEVLPGHAFVAIGAVLAALIAGFFSLLNLVTSKEQKVSEFRQAWIDELRQEVARYSSAVTYLSVCYSAYRNKNKDEKDIFKFYETVRESYEQVVHTYTAISLRINKNEKNEAIRKANEEFLAALDRIRELFNEGSLKEARVHCDTLREKCKPILKEEWERVKKGEPTYSRTKSVATAILIVGLVGAVVSSAVVVSAYYQKQKTGSPKEEQKFQEKPANNRLQPTSALTRRRG